MYDKLMVNMVICNPELINKFGIPQYKTEGSAGMDLCACIAEPLTLQPNEVKLIPSGISIHVGNPGYAAVLLPRSGMGHKNGIVLGNLVGLIDSDFCSEVQISCWNRGKEPFTVEPGMRIAQMVIIKVEQVHVMIVDKHQDTIRGGGSFGSTGNF